jgi:hypothetical protein
MRTSSRTAKELREQLASDNSMLERKMSDLLSLRKIVAEAEIAARAQSRRPSALLMRTRASAHKFDVAELPVGDQLRSSPSSQPYRRAGRGL